MITLPICAIIFLLCLKVKSKKLIRYHTQNKLSLKWVQKYNVHKRYKKKRNGIVKCFWTNSCIFCHLSKIIILCECLCFDKIAVSLGFSLYSSPNYLMHLKWKIKKQKCAQNSSKHRIASLSKFKLSNYDPNNKIILYIISQPFDIYVSQCYFWMNQINGFFGMHIEIIKNVLWNRSSPWKNK